MKMSKVLTTVLTATAALVLLVLVHLIKKQIVVLVAKKQLIQVQK